MSGSSLLPAEILRQVRRIEILTNRVVNETMAGRYESVFKGRGIEFDEVREYQPGDEVRSIDWNVTARTGRAHIKRFVEERELTVMLLVDMSRSMAFGSAGRLKQRIAAELCAVLAFSAIKNHDKVGMILFTDRIERFIPPKKGAKHVLRVIREALSFKPEGKLTDAALAVEYLSRVIKRKTVTFLISDFFCGDILKPLTVANRRHDVIAAHLIDPRERELPDVGWVALEDAEGGKPLLVDGSREAVRRAYADTHRRHLDKTARMLRLAGVDAVPVRTDLPYLDPLLKFFRMRASRRALTG